MVDVRDDDGGFNNVRDGFGDGNDGIPSVSLQISSNFSFSML